MLLNIWQFGSPMVIFLAGLKQIPQELYDAAAVDGASAWRRFWSVTVPLLTPIIFFNVVLQIIQAFQAFTPAYVVSGGSGGPSDSTLFYTLYLYQQGFTNLNMGYASRDGMGAAADHRHLHADQLRARPPLGLLRGPLMTPLTQAVGTRRRGRQWLTHLALIAGPW